jgi:hypothetical protein
VLLGGDSGGADPAAQDALADGWSAQPLPRRPIVQALG